jgi:anti-sigma regulatory factor (Ser/Thr protein kinase)
MAEEATELRLDGTDLDRMHPWLETEINRLPASVRHAMHVVLEEAVLNVALHAFPPGDKGEIVVRLQSRPDNAVLVVEDAGAEFDPTTVPVRDRPANPLDVEPGGLGLTLLRHYCEHIQYERTGDGNRLTLRFPLHPS